jgi:hypothetical protein
VIASPVKPVVTEFSPSSRRFEVVIDARDVAEPIDIYLPVEKLHALQPVHYPDGYTVEYAGSLRSEFERTRLRIWLDPSLAYHVISIVPR